MRIFGFEKSTRKNKKYAALLLTAGGGPIIKVHFGDRHYESYQDKTGLNLYPTHGDKKRRALYRKRHKVYLKNGKYSPAYFSYYYLW